ncbi:MAG: sensor histidine kinase [Burkholderiales bacterium]
MRILGIIGYGFMALVLGAAWGYLYWQSSSQQLEAAASARTALDELRAVDSGWNQRLVAAKLQPASALREAAAGSSAHLSELSARYRLPYARLETRALQLGSPQVGRELAPLRQAFAEKAELIARHAQASIKAAGGDAADAARAAELRAAADVLFELAWLASTGPRIDTLGRAIDGSIDDAIFQAELHRVGLLYFSGFLLVVLAFLAWNLDQRRRQLREANEGLEARVAERTRELSDALARLKESEAMLVQSEKMSSLGQMVAGIAHEVNTPLAYVKASLAAVGKGLPDAARLVGETDRLLALLSSDNADEGALAAQFAEVRALVDALGGKGAEGAAASSALADIERLVKDGLFGIGQIAEIVTNLKNFSRVDRSMVGDYDLHEGIESAIRIGQAQLQNRVLRRDFGAIPRITCSPSQINQVILNLLVNAAQATRDGDGTITVRTTARGADHVAVEVTDNGSGIPEDVLPKIFDPFFTTKPVGKGTGLGLSICYKIVENHGGKLEVRSKPGAGTRFTMVLPVTPPAAAAAT